jgi:hypothetical protein
MGARAINAPKRASAQELLAWLVAGWRPVGSRLRQHVSYVSSQRADGGATWVGGRGFGAEELRGFGAEELLLSVLCAIDRWAQDSQREDMGGLPC